MTALFTQVFAELPAATAKTASITHDEATEKVVAVMIAAVAVCAAVAAVAIIFKKRK